MDSKNEIIFYYPDSLVKLEVRLEDETVWLTQIQIVVLFQSSKGNISEHIKNIYESGELSTEATVRKFRTVRFEGERNVTRNLDYYNLDVIISVGYRVNTKRGIEFRQWANGVLKDYLLKGYIINNRLEKIEQKLSEHDQKIELFIKTALPPLEGILYDGQIFDAYSFACDLIRSAKKSIVLIDNYVDDSVLLMLSKKGNKVSATIYTQQISKQLELDIEKHNSQYAVIDIKVFKNTHDRFLIIDETVYHIGASLKDLGKKWFAFSKLQFNSQQLLNRL